MNMNQNNNTRHRRRSTGMTGGILAAGCVFLTMVVVAGIIVIFSQRAQIRELRSQLAEEAVAVESLSEQQISLKEGTLLTAEQNSQETQEKEEQPETTAVTETTTEAVTEAATEPEPKYLSSLSGLEPGTVLSTDQIDFDHLDQYFMSWEIEEGDNLYQRINGKSYRANDYVPLSSLCYLKMPHYNFNGQIQVGEMIVSKDIKSDVFAVFKELFENQYQIQSMYLVDNYWTGDPDTTDTASIDVNNTSAFCFRQATGSKKLSNHAYGKAIDLNPQQNPYVSYSTGSPKWAHSNANDYIDRSTGLAHVITHEDLAYKVFAKYGFRWGGDWTNPKDYQHFDKNN